MTPNSLLNNPDREHNDPEKCCQVELKWNECFNQSRTCNLHCFCRFDHEKSSLQTFYSQSVYFIV